MECGEMRWRDAQKTDIIYDSEYHTKYVKNQIIVHVSEETKKYQMRQIAAELNADIIGILEHKGDYQLAFRNDKSLKELYELADRLNAYSFVETAAPYILETESASVSADKGDDMVLKGH